jgi:hypothetical protein
MPKQKVDKPQDDAKGFPHEEILTSGRTTKAR